MSFQDVLAALAVVLNGIPLGLLALTFGFAAFPTALAFLTGIGGIILTGQVAPISYQAESVCLAGTLGEDRNERLNIVFFSGIIISIVGLLGLIEPTINFMGEAILSGMMAGVGITLAKLGIDMLNSNRIVTATSITSALLVYFITDDLVYTIVISVFLSSLVSVIINRNKKVETEFDLSNEKLEPIKLRMSKKTLRGVLALTTVQLGGNIAYGSITGGLANTIVNNDLISIYSGLATAISSFFGGGPIAAIISGTGVAPNPKLSGIIMMGIIALILLTKLLPKIGKYVPSEAIGGFLFILGSIVVFPSNIASGVAADPIIAGITSVVTVSTDPFIGMIAGLIVKILISIF